MSNTTDWDAIAQKLHQDCRAMEGKLAEVTKQRDALMEALKQIASGAWGWKTCVDVIAPKAIADVKGQTVAEVQEELLGVKIQIDDTVPNDTVIVKGGEG